MTSRLVIRVFLILTIVILSGCTSGRTSNTSQSLSEASDAASSDNRQVYSPGQIDNPSQTSENSGETVKDEGFDAADIPETDAVIDETHLDHDVQAEWPSDVPVMPELITQNFIPNTIGGFTAVLTGNVSESDVEEFYSEALNGWNEREPIASWGAEPITYQQSAWLNDRTFDMHITRLQGFDSIYVTIMYNWRTLPDEFPLDWPTDFPIPENLEYLNGFTGSNGETGCTYGGDLSMLELADFYESEPGGWSYLEESNHVPSLGSYEQFSLTRDMEIMVVTALMVDDLIRVRYVLRMIRPGQ